MSSGIRKILMIILVPIMIIVLLASIFYVITDGIIEQTVGFFNNLKKTVEESGMYNKFLDLLGVSKVKNGMPTFVINKETVEQLKSQLEGQSIQTDKCGLTQVRLRKILLAYAVSNSFSDTLCTAELSEAEIIANIKEKDYGKDFTEISEFTSYCVDNGKTIESKSKWPISSPNYTLYKDSDTFFYFQDMDGILGDKDKWYLGAMGVTTISTEDGTELKYFDAAGFAELLENYNKLEDKDKEGSTAEKQLLTAYTKLDSNKIKVYNIITNQKKYDYIFENKNLDENEMPDESKINGFTMEGLDQTSTYEVKEQEIDLSEEIDTSLYSIPIELMMNLLDMTGSGEFVETFIDYALEKINATVKAYTTMSTTYTYKKTEYNVNSDFILEMYDMDDWNGVELTGDGWKIGKANISWDNINGLSLSTGVVGDNFKAYKGIIFDRKYEGSNIAKVTDIENFEEINYNNTPNGDTEYKVDGLNSYLKTAYNPKSNFDLGTIKVTEVITDTEKSNSWTIVQSKINTWYGEIDYSDPVKETIYTIPDSTGESTKEEFDEFTYKDLTKNTTEANQAVEKKYISNKLVRQVDSLSGEYTGLDSDDIYDNAMETKPGKENESHYWNWTMKGLSNIAIKDGADKYNDDLGGGKGTDYIYCKYNKTNVKKYSGESKSSIESIDTSNVTRTSSNIEEELRNFLELLKNTTGKIPTSVGSEGGFEKDGIVVKYGDIYKGHIPAGDLLLDNGARILFDILERYDNTQGLVNVFKYLAYLYSGVDYGITDVSQIAFLFDTTAYSGTSFTVNTSLSEKNMLLTKEQLTNAINKTYNGKTKENLLSSVDAFMEIQTKYKVNPVFAVAVTIIESSGGTNWDAINPSTYNWYSIKGRSGWRNFNSFSDATLGFGELIAGSNYFGAGKYTVTDIAPTYCSEAWGVSVSSEMTKIYNSIGVSVNAGGLEGTAGDVTTFTVNGKTYKNYKQIEPAYKNIPLACYSHTTLYRAGCAITSDAIIASGFGKNVTPVDVNKLGMNNHPGIVQKYTGKKCEWEYSNIKNGVIEQLKKGYPVMVHVNANNGTFATKNGHFFVILSISENGKKIYVSNPSSRKTGYNNGWVNTSVLNESAFNEYMKMGG